MDLRSPCASRPVRLHLTSFGLRPGSEAAFSLSIAEKNCQVRIDLFSPLELGVMSRARKGKKSEDPRSRCAGSKSDRWFPGACHSRVFPAEAETVDPEGSLTDAAFENRVRCEGDGQSELRSMSVPSPCGVSPRRSARGRCSSRVSGSHLKGRWMSASSLPCSLSVPNPIHVLRGTCPPLRPGLCWEARKSPRRWSNPHRRGLAELTGRSGQKLVRGVRRLTGYLYHEAR